MTDRVKNIVVIVFFAAFVFVFFIGGIALPDADVSAAERRKLAKMPELTADTVLSGDFMTKFETYSTDQFPLRDLFRSVKAAAARYIFGQKDVNKLYVSEGYISKLDYPLDERSVHYAAERFNLIYSRMLKKDGVNVYLSVIPDKNYFMAEQNGYPDISLEKLTDILKADMPFAKYIDITDRLELTDYYRTDTHWKQESIVDVAEKLGDEIGTDVRAEYDEVECDKPFYGVYYGQAALPADGDDITYLTNKTLENCTVYDYETDSEIGIYALEKLSSEDPYEIFLAGSKALLRIENPDSVDDRKLVVFRDSFASSLIPLLAQGYSEIVAVDIRYLPPERLAAIMEFDNCDVLFIYSTMVLNNSVTLK